MSSLKFFVILFFALLPTNLVYTVSPRVAVVIAHPDDESTFAVTLYKLAQEMHADIDVILITNGEAGYKYSTLSEPFYQLPLTDEKIGRKHLPFIRKREALNGGKILGIRNYYFLEEEDTGYTKDPVPVLQGGWNIRFIEEKLQTLFAKNHYDFVFVMLPIEETHGHHKAATILALEAVKRFNGPKPIILGEIPSVKAQGPSAYCQLNGYPITKANSQPIAVIDRTHKFGFNNCLDYQAIVNWLIAEHKSQGTLQLAANKWELENFYFFDINDPNRLQDVKQLFQVLENKRPLQTQSVTPNSL